MVSYDEIQNKNASFSAGHYFKTIVEYVNLDVNEFNKEISETIFCINELTSNSLNLEKEIIANLEGIKYDS